LFGSIFRNFYYYYYQDYDYSLLARPKGSLEILVIKCKSMHGSRKVIYVKKIEYYCTLSDIPWT